MGEFPQPITDVLLQVVVDPGHNGLLSEYRIDSDKDSYAVTLRISQSSLGSVKSPFPQPLSPSRSSQSLPTIGNNHFEGSHVTEVLAKDRWQVKAFLRKLSTEFNVYELADLKPQYPFLHPTFYSFSFQNCKGKSHRFKYQIECSNHLDETYKALIQEFDSFFESRRVFDNFFKNG